MYAKRILGVAVATQILCSPLSAFAAAQYLTYTSAPLVGTVIEGYSWEPPQSGAVAPFTLTIQLRGEATVGRNDFSDASVDYWRLQAAPDTVLQRGYDWDAFSGYVIVDANGAITDWSVRINDLYYPGDYMSIRGDLTSSPAGDSLYAAYLYAGGSASLNNHYVTASSTAGGTWAVSAVPEPEAAALLLPGIALAGFVAARRRKDD